MILVKFYTEDERRKIENDGKYSPLGFGDLFQFGKKPEELEVLDWQSVFSSAYSGSGTPPFRDSVSVDFLEQLGITFVDMDWYSVMYKGVRIPLSHLDDGFKIALSAITCSRQGKYMWFSGLGYDVLEQLAELPMDILFAICRSELEDIEYVTSLEFGCKFVNFPYQDGTIEVICKPYHTFDKNCYKEVLYSDDNEAYVYKGEDGIHYCDECISYVLQYRWWMDIDNIIKYIDSCKRAKVYLAKPSQTYNLLEFGEILAGDENAIAKTRYLNQVRKLERAFHTGKITKGNYESSIQELQSGSMYDEYLYFRDVFKVVCHMVYIPEESGVLKKDQVIISVNKCPDGTYHLTGDLAHFEPEIGNAISSMFNKNGGNYMERVSLVFRQDNSKLNYISSVRGIIDRTVFGFKVMEDCIEIFDTYEAVQVFGAALKEAQDSGKCTGYTWIRRVI